MLFAEPKSTPKALVMILFTLRSTNSPAELPEGRLGEGLKPNVAVRVPEGLISHSSGPGLQLPIAAPVPLTKVNFGLEKVKAKVVKGPELAGTLDVLRKAVSICNFSTSMSCGPVAAIKSKLPGLSTAAVRVTWNESMVTFVGGASFIDRIIVLPLSCVEALKEVEPPQPGKKAKNVNKNKSKPNLLIMKRDFPHTTWFSTKDSPRSVCEKWS